MKFYISLILFGLSMLPINAQENTSQQTVKIKLNFYEIKNDGVYYGNNLIEGADPDSFVILSHEFSHTWGKDKNKVYYVGGCIEGVDPKTINVLSTNIAKDKKHVIGNGQIINEADASSFVLVNRYFAKDKNNVYDLRNFIPVEGANIKSIRSINERYSKDKNQVYLEHDVIPNADPKTFHIIDTPNALISKDKNSVYLGRSAFQGSDPKTFTLLKDGYMKDKNQVYYYNRILKNADSSSFEFIPGRHVYTRDKNHLYFEGYLLEGIVPDSMKLSGEYVWDNNCAYSLNRQLRFVDIASFEVLSPRIAKDRKNIYYCDRIVKKSITSIAPDINSFTTVPHTHQGDASQTYFKDHRRVFLINNKAELEQIAIADPNTFVEIHFRYGKDHRYVYMGSSYFDADLETFIVNSQDFNYATDKNRAYYMGKPLEQSDSGTFEVIPYTPYSKDDIRVWHVGQLMPDADAKTFTRVQGDYFKDKNAVYFKGLKLSNVNPDTFDPNKSPYIPIKRLN